MNYLKKMAMKSKLKSCFRAADLTMTRRANNKTYVSLPLIHDITFNEDHIRFVFTIPNGVDPKLVTKNDYVFKQYFGESIEIKGGIKKFVMKIYNHTVKMVPYDFEKYAAAARSVNIKLPIICGDDTTTGTPILFDMITRPHILNAGETGGGKSTWLRSVLSFLIQFMPPNDLHLYLCDLKAVEFMLFRNIDHVKSIQTEPEGVYGLLQKLNKELDKRQALMVEHEATHIDKVPNRPPYIVCCIDEFQDLRGHDQAMELLMRIGAKGRALGVFLILTTQRPSAAIVDGDIKANLTVSMAFKTKNKLNSNMILDAGAPDASKLRGQGHGIVSIDEYYEIQSPFLDEDAARNILEPFKVEKKELDITDLVEIKEEEQPKKEDGPL